MNEKRMTVRDFIGMDVDMDVYDDMTEELAIAFVGPMKLTAAGEERFRDVLDMPLEITEWSDGRKEAYLVLSEDEEAFEKNLKEAKTFFCACAGYCNDEDYEAWFEEV